MKTVVIYYSQTGFTQRYAQWIAQEAGADCFPLSDAKSKNLDTYDAIIFGGWAHAGSISKQNWFQKHMGEWTGKKLIVFCVGGSPADNPEIIPTLEKNFRPQELDKIQLFYCPGGFCYEKMPASSKLMMTLFIKALQAKKDKTPEEEAMASMIVTSYDISDKKYIAPILDALGH